MPTYTNLSGRTFDYDAPEPAVADFLARVERAAADPAVSHADMVLLVYGRDNPLLDRDTYPGRAAVTAATLARPVWRVMADLVFVKEVREGRLDLAAAHAPFTVDLLDAAHRLGVTKQAVWSAIDTERLPAVFRGGQWFTSPAAISAFTRLPSGRLRKRTAPESAGALRVRVGGAKGASLSLRGAGVAGRSRDAQGVLVGSVPAGWSRLVVRTTTAEGTRAFELEPAPGGSERLEHAGLYVEGPFRVAARHNSTAAANRVWKSYAPAKTAAE